MPGTPLQSSLHFEGNNTWKINEITRAKTIALATKLRWNSTQNSVTHLKRDAAVDDGLHDKLNGTFASSWYRVHIILGALSTVQLNSAHTHPFPDPYSHQIPISHAVQPPHKCILKYRMCLLLFYIYVCLIFVHTRDKTRAGNDYAHRSSTDSPWSSKRCCSCLFFLVPDLPPEPPAALPRLRLSTPSVSSIMRRIVVCTKTKDFYEWKWCLLFLTSTIPDPNNPLGPLICRVQLETCPHYWDVHSLAGNSSI